MKQVLVVLAGLVMAFVLGRMLVLAFVSDETKIRWLVEEMEELEELVEVELVEIKMEQQEQQEQQIVVVEVVVKELFQVLEQQVDLVL